MTPSGPSNMGSGARDTVQSPLIGVGVLVVEPLVHLQLIHIHHVIDEVLLRAGKGDTCFRGRER